MGRFHPTNLLAAWWAIRTARRTRRLLDAEGLEAALLPPPPPRLPAEAERGVRGALRRWRETCLVNAIVIQAWEAAHDRRRDLVVGITAPDGFRAHAWLDGDSLPALDDEGVEPSILDGGLPEGWAEATKRVNGTEQDASGETEGTPTSFSELLRRPAPHFDGARFLRPR